MHKGHYRTLLRAVWWVLCLPCRVVASVYRGFRDESNAERCQRIFFTDDE